MNQRLQIPILLACLWSDMQSSEKRATFKIIHMIWHFKRIVKDSSRINDSSRDMINAVHYPLFMCLFLLCCNLQKHQSSHAFTPSLWHQYPLFTTKHNSAKRQKNNAFKIRSQLSYELAVWSSVTSYQQNNQPFLPLFSIQLQFPVSVSSGTQLVHYKHF